MKILLILSWPLGQGGHINSALNLSELLIKDYKCNISVLAPYGEKVALYKDIGAKYNNYLCSKMVI